LAISFGCGSSNEIANPGSNFNGKWDYFIRRDAGQGNRDIALPIPQFVIRMPQGKRADGAHPQGGTDGNSFPEFILGWTAGMK
jgi:hypothetical protein